MSHSTKPIIAAEPVEFSAELLAKMEEAKNLFPDGKEKSALLKMLHLAQAEFGWVSVPTMDKIADLLSIQPVEVYDVLHHVSP
jgi:NADH-quinone oxidoreductase subunit E